MRIVGGEFRGRRLTVPEGRDIRPTSDRAREAVFNILVHGLGLEWETLSVLDVFAGTGAVGLEALSRGAAHATFIDNNGAAIHCIRENAGLVGAARTVSVLKLDATRLPPPPLVAEAPCGLAFLDPPYGSGLVAPTLVALAARGWIGPGAISVVEMGAKEAFKAPDGFATLDDRRYGAARVLFLERG